MADKAFNKYLRNHTYEGATVGVVNGGRMVYSAGELALNPLTPDAAYIRVFIFYQHIKYHILNMLKIKCDINQHYLKRVNLHFVKSE